MAALAPIATVATLAATGVGVAATLRQSNAQRQAQQAQASAQAKQDELRRAELTAQRTQDSADRAATLARTVAATRARLGAAGIAPDDGSAGAITAGMEQTAAEAEGTSDAIFRQRLSRGRGSLLASDGTLSTVAQVGRSLGQAARSLLA
jgi:hypothetical protein